MNSGDDEAKKLATRLNRIQQALRDAEREGVTDPTVKSWLDELEEIAYEIDDALDEREWENIRLQMEEEFDDDDASHPWQKLSSFLQSVCLCFRKVVVERREVINTTMNIKQLNQRLNMNIKQLNQRLNLNMNMKQLNQRLDLIGQKYGNRCKFVPNVKRDQRLISRNRTTMTSFVDVSEVHGRDGDKEAVVSMLLSESRTEIGVPVISIVGVGGMGKTTLAQIVYNDDRVKNHFEERVWLSVSHLCDEIETAKAVLNALTNKKNSNNPELETLLQCIADEVSGKNFLLLLDDVWMEDDTLSKPLRIALNRGGPRSRILVTTRNAKVAGMMGSTQVQIQSLQPLSNSHCWALFKQVAFRGRTESVCKILEETGLRIVEKCKGLPLAAKAIGSHLHKSGLQEWQKVLRSHVWEWEVARTEIFPVLELSFHELHPVAKRCFSFCAVRPKDAWISVDMLIRTWCAHGLLSSVASSDDAESKGREIFDDLAMRGFFQDFKRDTLNCVAYCKMHHILHEFSWFLAKDEYLIAAYASDVVKLANEQSARHLNQHTDKGHISPEKCRGLLTISGYSYYTLPTTLRPGYYDIIPTNLLRRLKRVRVLSLPCCEMQVREIASLIHLRYLDLTGSRIGALPETICDLYNLETLILVDCVFLSRLPQGMHKLRKLKHLLNDGTRLELPDGFDELTNLWTLSKISATRWTGWKELVMLWKLNQLRGCLSIDIENVKNAAEEDLVVKAAETARLECKHLIEELYLFLGGKVPSQVMEALQPHRNLTSLTYSGPHFPKWIATLTHLRELTISITEAELARPRKTGSCSALPPLGELLPFLENLWLCRMVGMERLSRNFLGIHTSQPTTEGSVLYAFQRLKRLTFSDCEEWEEWEDISEEEENSINISILPSLEFLELSRCAQLQTLPRRLLNKASSLKHLIVDGCGNLRTTSRDLGGRFTDIRMWMVHKWGRYGHIGMDERDRYSKASEYLTLDVIKKGKLQHKLQ